MDLNLNGKWALVTGGSKGIGLASAKAMAAEGVNIHLAARTAYDLDKAKADIAGRYNVAIETHAADLSEADVRKRLVDDIGALDILVNNAGAIPGGSITDLSDAVWRDAWELKIFGYIHMARMIFPVMCANGAGVIINIAGICASCQRRNIRSNTISDWNEIIFFNAQRIIA